MSATIRKAGTPLHSLAIVIALMAGTSAWASDNPATGGSPPAGNAPSSIVDDFHRLIDSHQLTELRTTYNGSYGASLLFQPDKLSYYIALFHGKDFWRVIRTDSYDDAENIYHTFVAQTEELAKVDLDTLRLKATKDYTDHLVAMNQQRLQNLERDSEYQRQQAQQVAAQQQQASQQSSTLTADLRASTSELDAVKERIHALESQQANPSLTLPPSEHLSSPSSPASAPTPADAQAAPGSASSTASTTR
jgi:hypothetical protein